MRNQRFPARLVVPAAAGFTLILAWQLWTNATKEPWRDQSGRGNPGASSSAEARLLIAEGAAIEALARIKAIPTVRPDRASAPEPERAGLQGSPGEAANTELTWSILDRCYNYPPNIKSEDLLRHRDLNPRRIPITEVSRVAVFAFSERSVDELRNMLESIVGIRKEELGRLADAGVLRPLRYSTAPEIQAEMTAIRAYNSEQGFKEDPVFDSAVYYENARGLKWFVRRDGQNYGAGIYDLPHYRSYMTIYVHSVAQFYLQLCAAAGLAGWLDPDEDVARQQEAAEWTTIKLAGFQH